MFSIDLLVSRTSRMFFRIAFFEYIDVLLPTDRGDRLAGLILLFPLFII